MFKKDQFKIRRDDYYRVLTTEVIPYETPLIFNSFGLYGFLKYNFTNPTAMELQKKLKNSMECKHSIPMTYKIKKNSYEFRKLKLIHPLSQIAVKNFYEKYEDLILYYCESSPFSIRAPQSIAKSFYKKNLLEDINKFRSSSISTSKTEEISKYSPSFYSYRGFNRLYKFFDAKSFFNIEARYSEYCSADISKCFDSIYTHSIAWAVKDKQFTKENVKVSASFANEFDSLMQKMNHNETNGIVIGPEFSRIFAEIILQEIDIRIINRIKDKYQYTYGNQYLIKRYVDDFFIFSKDKDIQNKILICLSDILGQFNLHLNKSKTEYLSRPFITQKSKIIHNIKSIVNDFFEKFLESESINSIKPLKIRDKWKLTRSFIHAIQSECKVNDIGYNEVSSYVISSITERVKKLVNIKTVPNESISDYVNAIEVLLDIQFFLFNVAPSTNSSYKICTSVILCIRFSEEHLSPKFKYISKLIHDHMYRHLSNIKEDEYILVDDYLPIEAINLILASTELSIDFMLPEAFTLHHFNIGSTKANYFHLISSLYYSSKYPALSDLKKQIIANIEIQLNDLDDFCYNTNKAYLFFEALFHPDFKEKSKNIWIRKVFKLLEPNNPATYCTTTALLSKFYSDISSHHWHIDWQNIDLLSYLQKKDLRQAY